MSTSLGCGLSKEALIALVWIRDHTHHIGRWLVDGRQPTTQPPESWTHMELKGHSNRIRIPTKVWAEIAPYHWNRCGSNKLFDLNSKGLDVLTRAGL